MALVFVLGTLTINNVGLAISPTGPTPIPGNIFPLPDNSSAPIIPPNSTAQIPTASSSSGTNPNATNNSLSTSNIISSAATTVYPITSVQSGLVVKDPLNNQTQNQQQLLTNSKYWIFGGDAPDENATYSVQEDKAGLHIGVKAPANGTWAGFYAASPDTNATLFHAVVTTPVRTIPYQYYENGLYVQTSQPLINYVTCVSVSSSSGTVWAVVSTTGDANQATQFNVLWVDTSPNQPLTRDCSIVTNGQNMLKVYLDHVLVYSSNTLTLAMPSPYNSYLEPETSYNGKLLKGTFKNYFATTNENMTVTNNPIGSATAKLVNSKGAVLASAPVDLSGTATFDMALYTQPMPAFIKVYDSSNTLIASTSNAMNIYGGDIYSVNHP